MPNYKRATFPGGYYFFTVITYQRRKLFLEECARQCLREAINDTTNRQPYETIAFCLLPEHLHCLWKLPEGDANFSLRWFRIKGYFSKEYLHRGGRQGRMTSSRSSKQEAALWQRRFWEHQIRDEDDLDRHVDYIHYNPVKHGLVTQVEDWPWSTYHRFVREGFYGKMEDFNSIIKIDDNFDFGE